MTEKPSSCPEMFSYLAATHAGSCDLTDVPESLTAKLSLRIGLWWFEEVPTTKENKHNKKVFLSYRFSSTKKDVFSATATMQNPLPAPSPGP